MNKQIEWNGKFNDIELKIKTIRPTNKVFKDCQKYVQMAFKDALDNGALLKIQAEEELKKRNINVDFSDDDAEKLAKEIKEKEIILLKGRDSFKRLTKKEGRDLALEIRILRSKMNGLGSTSQELFARTAEKRADDEQWQYYIYACTLDANTNRPLFKSFEEFKENQDSQFVLDSTKNFYKNLLDIDLMARTTEVKWLIEHGFMNKEGQFINSDGKTVDENGRLIDSEGRLVNEAGQFVDIYGNIVDEKGNLVIDQDPEAYKD